MSLNQKILFGLSTLLIIGFAFSHDNLPDRDKNDEVFRIQKNLQDGDLIFRRGRSAESYAVIVTDRQSQFSHVGIIIKEKDEPYVIHAVPNKNKRDPDYVKKEKLADFLAPDNASKYAIFRSDFPRTINEMAARHALQFYRDRLLFDNDYDLSSNDKLYCTELVIKAFNQSYLNLKTVHTTDLKIVFVKKKMILPGNIIENPHFIQIINH